MHAEEVYIVSFVMNQKTGNLEPDLNTMTVAKHIRNGIQVVKTIQGPKVEEIYNELIVGEKRD